MRLLQCFTRGSKKMDNRKPVYHSQSKMHRVVSRPNGLWVAQWCETEQGGTVKHDPWNDYSCVSMTKAQAIEVMHSRKPVV